MKKLQIRTATAQDIPALVHLLNQAYRKQHPQAWTTEAHLITGQRMGAAQLTKQLKQNDFTLYVANFEQQTEIIACIGVTYSQQNDVSIAEIGSFAVVPNLQGGGVGKQLLAYAEQDSQHRYKNLTAYHLYVLNLRSELLAFYQRRGYAMSGETADFPMDAGVGTPVCELHLIQLTKAVISLT